MASVTLATCVLALNAAWDLVTGTGLLIYIHTDTLKCLADTHLSLWLYDEERNNKVLSYAVGLFVIQWGLIRALAAMDPLARWPDAAATYGIEGVAIAVAVAEGKARLCSGVIVMALCLGCIGVLIADSIHYS
jgi:hypothetical protein